MRRALTAMFLLWGGAAGAEGPITATDAWIREAPPGATAMAGYVRLHNGGGVALECTRIGGTDFGAAELHRTVVEGGMTRMLREPEIRIAAGDETRLAPGGLHLMLFRPQRTLRAGDRTRLTMHCGERSMDIEFEIRKPE